METRYYTIIESPLGEILAAANARGLVRISFLEGKHPVAPEANWKRHDDDAILREATEQFRAYLCGDLTEFHLPLAAEGTAFQKRVWAELEKIPYGETATYGAIAEALDRPTASRAVGAANGRNPLPVIVPCHRVIGSDGSLTGYAGGVAIKERLLALEAGPDRSELEFPAFAGS